MPFAKAERGIVKHRVRAFITAFVSVAFFALLAGCGGSTLHSPNQPVSLTISAAISLKGPLDAF